jgi:hypothetical protein
LLYREDGSCRVRLRIGTNVVFSIQVPEAVIDLSANVRDGGECSFACRIDGKWCAAPPVFQSREGVWIGAKIGLLAAAEGAGLFADFDHLQFLPPQ